MGGEGEERFRLSPFFLSYIYAKRVFLCLRKQSIYISRSYRCFPREMTPEKRAQIFQADPDLGSASDWFEILLYPIRNSTQIWVVICHQYGISALVSRLRRHFAGKPPVASVHAYQSSFPKLSLALVSKHSGLLTSL